MEPAQLRRGLEALRPLQISRRQFSVTIEGWAGVPTTNLKLVALEFEPSPKRVEITTGLRRADVSAAFEDDRLSFSGFRATCIYDAGLPRLRVFAHFQDGQRFRLHPTPDVKKFVGDLVDQSEDATSLAGYVDGVIPHYPLFGLSRATDSLNVYAAMVSYDIGFLESYLKLPHVRALPDGSFAELDLIRFIVREPLSEDSTMTYKKFRITQGGGNVSSTVLMPENCELTEFESVVSRPAVTFERNVQVAFGGLIYAEGGEVVIDDPAARPELDFVAGQWEVMRGSFLRRGEVMVRRHGEVTHELPTGATLLGRVPFNYFHSLIEYLPRLETLRAGGLSNDVPLLVNDELPSAALEALDLVSEGWKTIRIKRDDVVKVDELWIPTFHTDHKDSTVEPWWKGAAFHWPTLDSFRRRILEKIDAPIGDRRVMLVRGKGSTTARGLRNIDKLAEIAQEMGFSILDPAELSFVDQVKMIRSAGTLISPGGAAFANLLFAHDQLRVLGLVSHQLSDFAIHANLARHAGASFRYLTGPSLVSPRKVTYHREYFHADFKISPRDFTREIKELCATR